MRCPRCDGARIAEAFRPGDEPHPIRLCLDCTAYWSAPEPWLAS